MSWKVKDGQSFKLESLVFSHIGRIIVILQISEGMEGDSGTSDWRQFHHFLEIHFPDCHHGQRLLGWSELGKVQPH